MHDVNTTRAGRDGDLAGAASGGQAAGVGSGDLPQQTRALDHSGQADNEETSGDVSRFIDANRQEAILVRARLTGVELSCDAEWSVEYYALGE
mgnify:CR=1 FL=1